MTFSDAVLPINKDGRIYHLNLLPDELADTIITVGDPSRVENISRHFDTIEHRIAHREFVTHTGYLSGKRLSVLSTGIGTSNIDIVLNEIDALANIDFRTRRVKSQTTSLAIIRFGTTGGLHKTSGLGSVVVTHSALGLDGLMHFYAGDVDTFEHELEKSFMAYMSNLPIPPYAAKGDDSLLNTFSCMGPQGITMTCPGFYGPQDRRLRLALRYDGLIEKLQHFSFKGLPILNFEMETAAIFSLGKRLGHRCMSIAAVLAHRDKGEFVGDPTPIVNKMIEQGLQLLVTI